MTSITSPQFPDRGTRVAYTTLSARTAALKSQVSEDVIVTKAAQTWVYCNIALSKISPNSATEDAEYAALAARPDTAFKKVAVETLVKRIDRLSDYARTEYLASAIKKISDRMTCATAKHETPVLDVLKSLVGQKKRRHAKAESVPA